MAPSALRASRNAPAGKTRQLSVDEPVHLSLAYRPPFAWEALLSFLRRDAVEGIELVDASRYGRTIELDGHKGFVFVENGGKNHVNVAISPSLVPVMMPLLARLRQLFDLDAEPTVIDAHLGQSRLAAFVARHPGVRIPGAFDGFDVALRTILRGRIRAEPSSSERGDIAAVVYAALGEPIETGVDGLSRMAPTAARVADVESTQLEALGVLPKRANAAIAVARLVADRKLVLAPGSDPVATRQTLTEIDGLGDLLAEVIVMRALSWPDALPVADGVLQRQAHVYSAGALQTRAEEWRPWRTYAALHLWLAAEAR
jgi:AraC family transcriptional regulator of adaptative response / DNA-3-methyladenine glycosylase II